MRQSVAERTDRMEEMTQAVEGWKCWKEKKGRRDQYRL